MPKIKVLSGGGFPEREVNSGTIGSLRDELDMTSGSTVAVNGTGVTDDYQLQDGDVVAEVTSNKTGGIKKTEWLWLYRSKDSGVKETWDLASKIADGATLLKTS